MMNPKISCKELSINSLPVTRSSDLGTFFGLVSSNLMFFSFLSQCKFKESGLLTGLAQNFSTLPSFM